MKILLTGSTGFFGKVIKSVLNDSFSFFELIHPNTLFPIRLDNEIPIFKNAFDIVIHSAGLAHSNANSVIERNRFFEVNVKGTQNLLSGLTLVGAPQQFVFISSVAVYGIDNGINISENEKLNAKDPYGLSKIHAEELISDWCKSNNVICTILRLPLVVGKNPPGNLGAMLKAIQKGYYFNIGGGKAKKSMVLAEDVARFIPIIAPIGGTYNLTDGNHPTFKDLSIAIAKKNIVNIPLLLGILIAKAGDLFGSKAPLNSIKIKKITCDLTFDDSKARNKGWEPKSVLEYLQQKDL
jgi:nucleoside-diphosphate-sugar epimerase